MSTKYFNTELDWFTSGFEFRAAYAFNPKFNLVARMYTVEGLVTHKKTLETGNRFRLDLNIKF